MQPCIIDLFAGVGGLSLGAVRAGFHLALAVELDKHAAIAHKKNFPRHQHLVHDIGQLRGQELLSFADIESGKLDGLIGGPPCQGFSSIGKRNFHDPRNSLFVHTFALIAECKPKFFVIENVPGILDAQFDDIRRTAFNFVEKDYTLLEPMKLKASDFGAATSRERIFFIGYLEDTVKALKPDDFFARKVAHSVTVEEALTGLPVEILSSWLSEEESWQIIQKHSSTSAFHDKIQNHVPKGVGDKTALRRYKKDNVVSGCFGTRHSPEVQERYNRLKHGEKDTISKSVRLKPDGLCPTLRAGTGADKGSFQAVRPIHPEQPRVITPREAARLQGFPDWFQFAPSKWHSFRQIGNSVSPILAEAVFSVIHKHLQTPQKHE